MIGRVLSILLIILGASVVYYTKNYEYTPTDPIGPVLIPEMLGYALIALSLWVLISEQIKDEGNKLPSPAILAIPALSAIYVLAIGQIGFIPSTIAFIYVIVPAFDIGPEPTLAAYTSRLVMWIKRPSLHASALFITGLIWGVFTQLLYIPMPMIGGGY